MSERQAFLDAIRAAPDEDAPRLIYADWLDERGEELRAGFIRYQVAGGLSLALRHCRQPLTSPEMRVWPHLEFARGFITQLPIETHFDPVAVDAMFAEEAVATLVCHQRRLQPGRLADSSLVTKAATLSLSHPVLTRLGEDRLFDRFACRRLDVHYSHAPLGLLPRGSFPEARALSLVGGNLYGAELQGGLSLLGRAAEELVVRGPTGFSADAPLTADRVGRLRTLALSHRDVMDAEASRFLQSLDAAPLEHLTATLDRPFDWVRILESRPWLGSLRRLALLRRDGHELPSDVRLEALGQAAPNLRSLSLDGTPAVLPVNPLRAEWWPSLEAISLSRASSQALNAVAASGLLLRLSSLTVSGGGGDGHLDASNLFDRLCEGSRLESLTLLDAGWTVESSGRYWLETASRSLRALKLDPCPSRDVAILATSALLPNLQALTLVPSQTDPIRPHQREELLARWGMRTNLFWS